MNLNSILIGSEDPKGLVDYYTKLFGEPTWSDGGYTGWMIGTGAVTVGSHDQVKGKNTEPGRVIWNIETADVKSEFDRFVEAGATVVQEPYSPGGEMDRADRHVRGPRRELLPAHEPDGTRVNAAMLLGEVAAASADVAATSSRLKKVERLSSVPGARCSPKRCRSPSPTSRACCRRDRSASDGHP